MSDDRRRQRRAEQVRRRRQQRPVATVPSNAEIEMPGVFGWMQRNGRIMVLMTHNTDVADSWEREGEDPGFFYQFSPSGYALGIDVLLHAMTH